MDNSVVVVRGRDYKELNGNGKSTIKIFLNKAWCLLASKKKKTKQTKKPMSILNALKNRLLK